MSITNLGLLLHLKGEHSAAEPLLREAVNVNESAFGPKQPETAQALVNLGMLYQELGDPARAVLLLRAALEIQEQAIGRAHPRYTETLEQLATVYAASGKYAEAEPLLRQSLERWLAALDTLAAVQSGRQQVATLAYVRDRLDNYLAIATAVPEHVASAYRMLLAWKGSVLARQSKARAVRDKADVKPLFVDLEATASRLSRVAYALPPEERRERWQFEVTDLSEKLEKLERALLAKCQKYGVTRSSPSVQDVRTALPSGAVLIDFVESRAIVQSVAKNQANGKTQILGKPRVLAFLVRRDAPVELIVLANPTKVQEEVDVWRAGGGEAARVALGMTGGSKSAGTWLREHVWQPLEDRIGQPKTVLLSPDGALAKLPFGALPGKQPGTYLIEDLPVAIVPSPQTLLELRSSGQSPATLRELLLLDALDEDLDRPPAIISSASERKAPKKAFGMPPGGVTVSLRCSKGSL